MRIFAYTCAVTRTKVMEMEPEDLPNFKKALLALGSTDQERAQRLGIPRRTFMDLKACRLPSQLRRVMRPELLIALAADAEAHRQELVEANA